MGQRVITLRKENKKEVLAYFIFNDYSFIKLLIILALLSYDIKKKKKKLHGILYCILVFVTITFSEGSVHNTFEGKASASSLCDNRP